MIDSHCHLDYKDFDRNRQEIINRAVSSGVHTMINIGVDLDSSVKSLELAAKHEAIFGTVGVHPHDAKTYNIKVEGELRKMLAGKKIVGVGEIGLDYYRDLSPRKMQVSIFERQLRMAVENDLPVVIHSRNSFDETIDILRDYADFLPGGVFHCFPGTIDDALKAIDLGFSVGIGGAVTYPESKMAAVASEIPLESILIETDAPFITPVPFRGKQNQPAYVKYVVSKIAELRQITFDEVEKVTDRNCQKLFRLVETFDG